MRVTLKLTLKKTETETATEKVSEGMTVIVKEWQTGSDSESDSENDSNSNNNKEHECQWELIVLVATTVSETEVVVTITREWQKWWQWHTEWQWQREWQWLWEPFFGRCCWMSYEMLTVPPLQTWVYARVDSRWGQRTPQSWIFLSKRMPFLHFFLILSEVAFHFSTDQQLSQLRDKIPGTRAWAVSCEDRFLRTLAGLHGNIQNGGI